MPIKAGMTLEVIVKNVGPDLAGIGLGIVTATIFSYVARPPHKKQYAYEVTNLNDDCAHKGLHERRPNRARQPVNCDGEGRESQQHAT